MSLFSALAGNNTKKKGLKLGMGTECDRPRIFSACQLKTSWLQRKSQQASWGLFGKHAIFHIGQQVGYLFSGCMEKSNVSEGFVWRCRFVACRRKEGTVYSPESRASTRPELPQLFVTSLESSVWVLCLVGSQGVNTGFLRRHSSNVFTSIGETCLFTQTIENSFRNTDTLVLFLLLSFCPYKNLAK